MNATAQLVRRSKFGAFEADPRSGELVKNGRRIRLQEQPFQLLSALLDRPGEVVTREELRVLLWPQTVVDYDHGLNKAVSKVREALGDSAESPRFVETVARRGYRFLADVTLVDENSPQEPASAPLAPVAELPLPPVARRSHRPLVWGGMALVLAALLVVSAFNLWPAPRVIRSLAVLPLANTSNDPSQDFFADGMTDELITQLGKVNALRVISRTSAMTYKGAHKPLATIARELNVDAVIEGSVTRAGDRMRITAQLIRAPDDAHVWANSFEGDVRDALMLQDRVAQAVAEQVRATLSHAAPSEKRHAIDPLAYENYLKGRYFLNKRTGDGLRSAIRYFRQAIDGDRNYAEAYSGLADAYALAGDWEYGVLSPQEAFSKATVAASKALELDGTLAEAHTSLAFALDLYGWDWDVAGSEYEAAIRLNPGYATAHHWYAWHLMLMGQRSRALAEFRRAESLDPLSLIIGADIADALCITGAFDAAVEQSRKTLELDPGFAVGHYQLGQALVQLRRYDEAIAEFRKAIAISGHSSVFDSNLAYAYALSGRRDDAIRIAAGMEAQSETYPSAQASIALIHVGLGDHEAALRWLDKAHDARFNPSILLRPGFDPLRKDPRFAHLMHRIGLGG